MNTPRPDDADREWWNGKTEGRARDYCPACEPDVDPLLECVVVSHCRDHDPALGDGLRGSADALVVRPPRVVPFTEREGEEGESDG